MQLIKLYPKHNPVKNVPYVHVQIGESNIISSVDRIRIEFNICFYFPDPIQRRYRRYNEVKH